MFWAPWHQSMSKFRCWTQRDYIVPMGFTVDDLERLKVMVTILWFDVDWKRWQIWGWTPTEHLYVGPTGFWFWRCQSWPWMTFSGRKSRSYFLRWIMSIMARVTMLEPWVSLWMTFWLKVKVAILWFDLFWLKTVTDSRLEWMPREDFFENSHWLSIGAVRFDLGWAWGVKNQNHSLWCQICRGR